MPNNKWAKIRNLFVCYFRQIENSLRVNLHIGRIDAIGATDAVPSSLLLLYFSIYHLYFNCFAFGAYGIRFGIVSILVCNHFTVTP